MKHKFTFVSSISSISSATHLYYTPETKSDIIAFAIGNPENKVTAKLSKNNQKFLGSDIGDLLIQRHNHELQRCSQFYSLASIFNETTTKDKHPMKLRNIKKMYSTGRKYFFRLFLCCTNDIN
ncbi:unnamed protein product [Adineta steineri]|uniref:Uncharacterized protein n=1 Tax=Adineta steineri TaxID=433720 RepID=A0A813MBC2_9BILA|nr:unnamed protein product [Adineta steineri]CAF0878566.1 unnamed protein product [Adineta steineri]CAF0889570.1 unnamed protein product [Adineta steineri]